jgi:hypothetical protein
MHITYRSRAEVKPKYTHCSSTKEYEVILIRKSNISRLQRKSVQDYNKIMLNGRVHILVSGRRIFGCNSMKSYASLLVRLSQYYLSYNTRTECYY